MPNPTIDDETIPNMIESMEESLNRAAQFIECANPNDPLDYIKLMVTRDHFKSLLEEQDGNVKTTYNEARRSLQLKYGMQEILANRKGMPFATAGSTVLGIAALCLLAMETVRNNPTLSKMAIALSITSAAITAVGIRTIHRNRTNQRSLRTIIEGKHSNENSMIRVSANFEKIRDLYFAADRKLSGISESNSDHAPDTMPRLPLNANDARVRRPYMALTA